MKKEIWKSSIEEVSIEEAARDFCEEYYEGNSDDFDDSELDDFIKINIKEISSEEKYKLKEEIKKRLIKQKEEAISEEKYQLKDRKSILEWLDNYIGNDDFLEEGNVGYYLSAREILDLIIKNWQK